MRLLLVRHGLTDWNAAGRYQGKWIANPQEFAPSEGESLSQLTARVQPNETVLVVARGGPLRVLVCLLLGLPPEMHWQFHLAPASISEIAVYPAGAILNRLNDTCHLDGENE